MFAVHNGKPDGLIFWSHFVVWGAMGRLKEFKMIWLKILSSFSAVE